MCDSMHAHSYLHFASGVDIRIRPKHSRLRCRDSPAADSYSSQRSWFSQAGLHCPKMGLADFAGLRGMVALGDSAAGEVLATVPYDSCLVVEPLQRCPFPGFCNAEYWKSSPWYVKASLELLHEKMHFGTTSRLRHYIADLKAIQIEMPVAWAEVDIRELQYPTLEAEIQRQRIAWEGLYQAFAAASPDSKVNMAEFLWALQAVRSRAFSGPYGGPRLVSRTKLAALLAAAGFCSLVVAHLPFEQVLNAGIAAVLFNLIYDYLLSQKLKWYALCPVIDYCNHSGDITSDVSYEYFKEGFSLSCSQAFSTGDQVFISYGKQSNDYLLQYYGFVELKNTNDKYVIRHRMATDVGYLELTALGPTPETEAMLLQEFADTMTVMKAVVEACEAETRRWPTTLQQDREKFAKLQTAPQASRLRLAIMFRMEKKALLEACIAQCRTKLQCNVQGQKLTA